MTMGDANATRADDMMRSSAQNGVAANDAAHDAGGDGGRVKRTFARMHIPLRVRVADQIYPVTDWSLSGFRVHDIADLDLVGKHVKITLIAPFHDFSFVFTARCEAVRIDPAHREAAFKFDGLTADQKNALSYIVSAYLAGRLANVDGVLKQIAPKTTSKAKTDADGERSRLARWGGVAKQAAVGLVGLGVTALLLRAVFLHAFSVPAAAAWIDVRQVEVAVEHAGEIERLAVAEGDRVAAGDLIVEMNRRHAEDSLAIARARLDRLTVAHANLQAGAVDRGRVLSANRDADIIERERRAARVESARAAVASAQDTLDRRITLNERGVVAQPAVTEARRELLDAEDALAAREAELTEIDSRIDVAGIGYFYGDTRVAGEDPGELSRDASDLAQQMEIVRAEIRSLETRLAEHDVVSPCDCVVVELPRLAGTVVGALAPVAILSEVAETPHVSAFTTRKGARRLRTGQRVTVRLPDGAVDDDARIVAINNAPRRASLADLAARDLPADQHAEIVIALSAPFAADGATPVEVAFVSSPWGWLERLLYVGRRAGLEAAA